MPSPLRDAELTPRQVRRARPLLGTLVDIGVCSRHSEQSLNAAMNEAFVAIEGLHHLMSYHDPNSELSRLNRSGCAGWQPVDPHTFRVIEAALRFASISQGAFDPTVGPRLEAWGYLPRSDLPTDAAATWRDVEIAPDHRIRFKRPLRLDLGGIAKGYAVDVAVETLVAWGVDDIVVNAGGDLRVAGPTPRQIQLRHPGQPSRIAHQLTVQDQALATSAAYFSRRTVPGGHVSALVDPRSGRPHVGGSSFTVCANDCMTADALTKMAVFAQASVAERALERFKGQGYVITAQT